MPLSPIDRMIMHAVRCVYCGAHYGECDCSREVVLECPACGRTKQAPRDKSDPPKTAMVKFPCPDCDTGGVRIVDYFDATGRQIDIEGQPMRTQSRLQKIRR